MRVYGPVMSRRLGLSLGIDPIASKSCNWNCVYCQLGRSFPMTVRRESFCDKELVLRELDRKLAFQGVRQPDWITLVGSGETLLSSDVGELILGIKLISEIPVAVITNGSLLGEYAVTKELAEADAVLPTLDAGDERTYKRMNRPHPSFTFEGHLDGLKRFRRAFKGKLWVEVMLVGGMNDSEEAISDICLRLKSIRPDEVHLLTPTRLPAEGWVKPCGTKPLMLAASIIGSSFPVRMPDEPLWEPNFMPCSFAGSVKEILKRHPLREDAIRQFLGGFPADEAHELWEMLFDDGSIAVIDRMGTRFLVHTPSRYKP